MEIQLRKGLLEVCVLKVLSRGDSYGYQIIKDISPHIEITESTLYPILKRLEVGGMLHVYSVEHNGRLRKYYQITESGRQKIQDFLEEWQKVLEVYRFLLEDGDHE